MKTFRGLLGLLLFSGLTLIEKRLNSLDLLTSYLLLGLLLVSVTLMTYLFADSPRELGKDNRNLVKFLGVIFLLFLLRWTYLNIIP